MTSTVKIPEGWIETIVESLVNDKILGKPMDGNHGNLHPKSSDFTESGVPFIMASDISNGKVDFKNCYYISESTNNTLQKGFAKPGDVLLTHKATIGKVALLGGEYPSITLTPQVTYYRVLNHDKLDNKYLYYYFLSPYFQNIFAMWSGAGSTRAYLGITDQRKLPIILPPLPEQKAIAGVLSSFDDKIELLRAENQTLEEMGQTLFKERFGKYKIEDELPDGWKIGKLTDIADFLNGIALQKFPPKGDEKGLPVVKIREMKAGITGETNRATKDIDEKYIIQNEDVLFSWSGSLELVFWEYGPGALNQHLFKVSSDKYPKRFYYYRIKHHLTEFRAIASNKATTMGHIQRCHLERAEVIIPSDNDLHKFDEVMDKLLKKIFNNKNKIHSLTETRDQLLPKLMSGEVRVEF